MARESEMAWYKQEEGKRALSRLETLLSQKRLAEFEDFEGSVSDEVYGLLTKIPEEKRVEFAYLADILVDYFDDCLQGPCSGNPAQIAERAALRKRQNDLKKMYFADQPCV